MSSSTGPVPQRTEQTVRRNKPDIPVEKVTVIGPVPIPDLNIPGAHPLVVDLYESMRESAQSRYYEPTDWQSARVALHFLNKLVKTGKPSAQMLATVVQMLTPLLLTEGERRRVRMEVERKAEGDDDAKVITIADRYREMFQQSQKPS